jgi:hypothetical protein
MYFGPAMLDMRELRRERSADYEQAAPSYQTHQPQDLLTSLTFVAAGGLVGAITVYVGFAMSTPRPLAPQRDIPVSLVESHEIDLRPSALK